MLSKETECALSREAQTYLQRPDDDWHDHQRVLPWGDCPPKEIAHHLSVDVATVYRWQHAVNPIPVEAAFALAARCGPQYLLYLAGKNHLQLVFTPVLPPPTQGDPIVNDYVALETANTHILALVAKKDRGETLTEQDKDQVRRWQAHVLSLTSKIARALTEDPPP